MDVKHQHTEEIILSHLVDLIYQSKFLMKNISGFSGLFKFSLLSWNYPRSVLELNLFYRNYLETSDKLRDYALLQSNKSLKDYILKMATQLPPLPYFPQKPGIKTYLLTGFSLLFFPLYFIILQRDFRHVTRLHHFLDKIIIISQSILKVSRNQTWLDVVATDERLN